MNIDLFSALFGGLLVGIGVYIGTLVAARLHPATAYELTGDGTATRPLAVTPVRKPTTRREPRAHRERQAIPIVDRDTPATKALGNDVVRALITSGFDRNEATEAVAACAGAERSTIDAWLRAALRKLNTAGKTTGVVMS